MRHTHTHTVKKSCINVIRDTKTSCKLLLPLFKYVNLGSFRHYFLRQSFSQTHFPLCRVLSRHKDTLSLLDVSAKVLLHFISRAFLKQKQQKIAVLMAKLEWNLQWEIGANVSWVHSLSPDMQIKKLEHATE